MKNYPLYCPKCKRECLTEAKEFITVIKEPDAKTQSYANIGGVKVSVNQKSSLWIRCPICGGKTRTKVYEDTVLVKFPLYCPKCKKEIRIDVVQLKMVLSK